MLKLWNLEFSFQNQGHFLSLKAKFKLQSLPWKYWGGEHLVKYMTVYPLTVCLKLIQNTSKLLLKKMKIKNSLNTTL